MRNNGICFNVIKKRGLFKETLVCGERRTYSGLASLALYRAHKSGFFAAYERACAEANFYVEREIRAEYVFADKTVVPLTKTEMSLLAFMMEEPQKTHSRDSMLDKIWGFDEDTETRAIDETVRRIRKKLSAAKSVVTIETVWGYGYKLSAAVKDE